MKIMKSLTSRVTTAATLAAAVTTLAACPSEPKQDPAKVVSATATPSATAPPTPPPPRRATPKKADKPKEKPTAATPADQLGTLPEGVGLAVGKTAPDFELAAHSRGKQSLDALLTRGDVLLVFYRGGW